MTRHIPDGAITIRSKTAPAVVYAYGNADKLYAVGYYGRATIPAFHHRFRSAEQRASWVASWLERQAQRMAASEQRKVDRRERLAKPHGLQVGDVLSASWGYEQTNVDYYEIVGLAGARTVEVRKIGARIEHTGDMQGQSVPHVGAYTGEPMRRRVDEYGGVRISDCIHASKLEPIAVINGARVYRPQHWTAYA